jgi:hypothetical protein
MREVEVRHKDEVDKKAEDTLSRLIVEQGVTPIDDLDQLAALWPADDDPDALMNYVLSERQAQIQLDVEDHQPK